MNVSISPKRNRFCFLGTKHILLDTEVCLAFLRLDRAACTELHDNVRPFNLSWTGPHLWAQTIHERLWSTEYVTDMSLKQAIAQWSPRDTEHRHPCTQPCTHVGWSVGRSEGFHCWESAFWWSSGQDRGCAWQVSPSVSSTMPLHPCSCGLKAYCCTSSCQVCQCENKIAWRSTQDWGQICMTHCVQCQHHKHLPAGDQLYVRLPYWGHDRENVQ